MKATSQHEIKNKRMSMVDKLQILCISEEHFKFYCDAFIKNWQRYMLRKNDEDWQLIKSKTGKLVKLDEHVVAFHLMGKYWAATFAPPVPRYLCIDIDASESLLSVYRIVRDWISHPIVFQSSSNKGLHVYAFLQFDFPIRANKLTSIASMELRMRGVDHLLWNQKQSVGKTSSRWK